METGRKRGDKVRGRLLLIDGEGAQRQWTDRCSLRELRIPSSKPEVRYGVAGAPRGSFAAIKSP